MSLSYPIPEPPQPKPLAPNTQANIVRKLTSADKHEMAARRLRREAAEMRDRLQAEKAQAS
jgi:hypothetical protein